MGDWLFCLCQMISFTSWSILKEQNITKQLRVLHSQKVDELWRASALVDDSLDEVVRVL